MAGVEPAATAAPADDAPAAPQVITRAADVAGTTGGPTREPTEPPRRCGGARVRPRTRSRRRGRAVVAPIESRRRTRRPGHRVLRQGAQAEPARLRRDRPRRARPGHVHDADPVELPDPSCAARELRAVNLAVRGGG